MSSFKIKYQNLNESKSVDEENSPNLVTDTETLEIISRQDENTFLLNYLLMSVQFFENYDRDIHKLRENWFKETQLESEHKKCFHADSLFRVAGKNFKFVPRHGIHKNSEIPLHPFRIYVSSDNMEAAYNPSALGRNGRNARPQYYFTVKTKEKNERSGCIHLVEYKARETPSKSSTAHDSSTDSLSPLNSEKVKNEKHSNIVYLRRKSERGLAKGTRLTATEKLILDQNKEPSPRLGEKRSSLQCSPYFTNTIIPPGAFYKLMQPEARAKPIAIQDFRMNTVVNTPQEIPPMCFQRQDVKQKVQGRRRSGVIKNGMHSLFKSQNVLNAAAYKGYFCDLLLEKLSKPLGLDSAALNMSHVLEEFIVVNQRGSQYSVAPVITIRDWKNFIEINKPLKGAHNIKKLSWPSSYMRKIINILPCQAVPFGHTRASEENTDYEKEWKLVFPKMEEFLLLHMMHAQVRCYFFALLIYKSFVETEINAASFGPKHLLHLLFWRVQRDFLAWPEDRPGETLLIYLKTLYKKLQNKCLCDFFIPSRNLFATSLAMDLHKAQAILKKIIENPVFCIIQALRNLRLNADFYPLLDTIKLYKVLSETKKPETLKTNKRERRQKVVHFDDDDDDDDEQRWKRNVIKQIELERKAEDKENAMKLSVESINTNEAFDYHFTDRKKWSELLEIFFSHYIQMTQKSHQFRFSSQAFLYLSHAQKLFDLIVANGENLKNAIILHEKLKKVKESCFPSEHGFSGSTFEEQIKTEKALQTAMGTNAADKNHDGKVNGILAEKFQGNENTSAKELQDPTDKAALKKNQQSPELSATNDQEELEIKIILKNNSEDDNDEFYNEEDLYETKL